MGGPHHQNMFSPNLTDENKYWLCMTHFMIYAFKKRKDMNVNLMTTINHKSIKISLDIFVNFREAARGRLMWMGIQKYLRDCTENDFFYLSIFQPWHLYHRLITLMGGNGREVFCCREVTDQIDQSTHQRPFSLRLNWKGAPCWKNYPDKSIENNLSLMFVTSKQARTFGE